MLRIAIVVLLLALITAAVGCAGGSGSGASVKSSVTTDPPGTHSSAISIFPATETLRIGGQRQFSGWDSTVGQYDVTWSLQEGTAGGTITKDGLYTAPETPGTFHLIATSSHNTSLRATAPLTIVSVGFVPVSDLAIARAGHTATLLLDGRVLIAGGTLAPTHSAELFVPATSGFAPTDGSMVHPRSGHCATLLQDGRVLIAGGADSHGSLFKTAELFDPATQTFTATGDLNEARRDATATLLQDGRMLIAGGQGGGSTAELYDPRTGRFSESGDMHFPRAQHTATLLSNGKVLLVGNVNATGSAELFDPVSGQFSVTGSLIQARAHHTATLLPNGSVLVLGGTEIMPPGGGGAAPASVSLDSAEIYDPADGAFHTAGKLLMARDSHSATLLPTGMVLVAGGYSHSFDGDAQPEWHSMFAAELFHPGTFASTPAASLEVDRAEHVVTMLNNGQVLVTGGIAGFQELCCKPKPYIVTLASSELYR